MVVSGSLRPCQAGCPFPGTPNDPNFTVPFARFNTNLSGLPSPVPEPTTLLLLGTGLAAVGYSTQTKTVASTRRE